MENFQQELLNIFMEEAEELLSTWESCAIDLEKSWDADTLLELFRTAHTLKGSSQTVGYEEYGNFVHGVEDLIKDAQSNPPDDKKDFIDFILKTHEFMDEWLHQGKPNSDTMQALNSRLRELRGGGAVNEARMPPPPTSEPVSMDGPERQAAKDPIDNVTPIQKKPKTEQKKSNEVVRVKREKIDKMINFVGELGTQLAVIEHQFMGGTHNSKESHEALEYCLKYIKQLQEDTISLSMQPIDRFLQRLERSIGDVARTTGKKIRVVKEGSSIELDKTVLDQIADPFIHIVRNAADHGIENAETRQANGKPAEGRIVLRAEQKSGMVEITVEDDGGGLDRKRILGKAIEKGIVSPGQELTDEAIDQLIMRPGFSTKQEVTEISGRGVGLDVVSATLNRLGGNLHIVSDPGKGTNFIVSIPTNFSMVESVIVGVAGVRYGIPLKDFAEIIDLDDFEMKSSDVGDQFFKMREEIVTLHNIQEYLELLHSCEEEEVPHEETTKQVFRAALINRNTSQPMAFEIDRLYGRLNLFVKPLKGKMANMMGVAGTAILPDGQAGLILNLSEIAKGQVEKVKGQVKYG